MTEIEIAEKAVREKVRGIAVIISKWHLTGVLSYVHDLRQRGVDGGTLIAVLAHPTSGYLVAEGKLPELSIEIVHCTPGVLLKDWDFLLKGWLRYCQRTLFGPFTRTPRPELHFLSVMRPQMRNLIPLLAQAAPREVKLILLDEGIGTYMPASHWGRVNAGELPTQRKMRRYLADFSKRIALSPLGPPQKRFLFDKYGEDLVLNDHVAKLYRNFFNDVYWRLYGKGGEGLLMPGGAEDPVCLYLSQPVVEQGFITEQAYSEILLGLSLYCHGLGLKLVVKPHPRESLERYVTMGVTMLYSEHVAEAVVIHLKPKFIVGISSTALVTIPCLFGIPSFSLIGVFKDNFSDDPGLFDSLAHFQRLFANYLTFTSNISDITTTSVSSYSAAV
jgi:hypothetical protein